MANPAKKVQATRPPCPTCGRPVIIIDPYLRISRATDGEGGFRSVADQELDWYDALAELPCCYQTGEVFQDPAISAWDPKKIRPDFMEAMRRLHARESDGMWVYDLTRFSRKPIEGEQLLAMAAQGARIISGTRSYDLTKADDRRDFRSYMVAAAAESDKISERTRRGKKLKATRRGQSNRSSRRGFGAPGWLPPPPDWQPGEPRVLTAVPDDQVEDEREALRHVIRNVLAGRSLGAQVRWLDEQGFLTTLGRRWTVVALRKTIERARIAGLVEHKGEVVEGYVLPEGGIVSQQEYHALTAFLSTRTRGRQVRQYLLTNLFRCGECGFLLRMRPKAELYDFGPDDPWTGQRRGRYICQIVPNVGGCGRNGIDRMYADEVVKKAVLVWLTDKRHRETLAQQYAASQAEAADIEAQIEAATQLQAAMAARVGQGMTLTAFDSFLRNNTARVGGLRRQLKELEAVEEPPDMRAGVEESWESWDLDERRRVVRQAFPSLTLIRQVVSERVGGQRRLHYARTPDRFDWDGRSLPRVEVAGG